MPMPPPKPALEFAGHAFGPSFSSLARLQTPVPRRSRLTPAGPYTLTWVIGEGTGPLVEPMVALPKAFVGAPSLDGEKPASVMVTVSSACAAVAASRNTEHASAAIVRIVAIILAPCDLGRPGAS